MSLESEQEQRRRTLEGRETGQEAREGKKDDAELKAAASLERADIIVKEVKNSRKQMQNIVLHMQTVVTAIRQLRQQLQLAEENDDPASVKQDKKQIEALKKKIKEYGDELEKMREDLVREQIEELSRHEDGIPLAAGKNGIGVGLSAAELRQKAEKMVEKMISEVKSLSPL